MTSSTRKIVRISPNADNKVLSKAQKQFNSLIQKMDTEKKRLLEWQAVIPQYNRKMTEAYVVLVETWLWQKSKVSELILNRFDGISSIGEQKWLDA